MSQLMEHFEHDFENLDVQSAAMDSSMASTGMLNAPEGQIEQPVHQDADEACRCLS